MNLDQLEKNLAALPRNERAGALHEAVVTAIASRPASHAAAFLAALREQGWHDLANAFENTAWEASFQRAAAIPRQVVAMQA